MQQIIRSEVTYDLDDEGLLSISWIDGDYAIQTKNLSDKEALYLNRYAINYDIKEKLLRRQDKDSSYTYRVAVGYIERIVKRSIGHETLKNGILRFNYGIGTYYYKVADYQHLDYETLAICRAINKGYKFREDMQSHFWVVTPLNKTRVVINNHCDCDEYLHRKSCLHQLLVKTLLNNRAKLKDLIHIV